MDTLLPAAAAHRTHLVIDCTAMFGPDGARDGETESALLRWVSAQPRRSDIHVYVDGGKARRFSRRLQTRLQAMGCRVATKHAAAA